MGKRKEEEEEEEEEEPPPLASVPSDLLFEILSRVPYRSLCRFKCVSRAWLALCSEPAVRRRSPQTLSGFFCYGIGGRSLVPDFLNMSGRGRPLVDPSLRFVRGYKEVTPVHCCAGILICYCEKVDMDKVEEKVDMDKVEFVVCNPATEEIWAVMPQRGQELAKGLSAIRLCFDPAVPRRFTVFVFMHGITRVFVYSSEMGQWTSVENEGSLKTVFHGWSGKSVFFNGALHLACRQPVPPATIDGEWNLIRWIVTVDMEGKVWRTIRMPHDTEPWFIGQSQGQLCAACIDHKNGCQLSVWVLEDYASGQWILKHTASILELLGRPRLKPGELYALIAVHPECNLIFLKGGVSQEETFMSYSMDNKKLEVICTLGESHARRFQPYTPCFVERPSNAHEQLDIC